MRADAAVGQPSSCCSSASAYIAVHQHRLGCRRAQRGFVCCAGSVGRPEHDPLIVPFRVLLKTPTSDVYHRYPISKDALHWRTYDTQLRLEASLLKMIIWVGVLAGVLLLEYHDRLPSVTAEYEVLQQLGLKGVPLKEAMTAAVDVAQARLCMTQLLRSLQDEEGIDS